MEIVNRVIYIKGNKMEPGHHNEVFPTNIPLMNS